MSTETEKSNEDLPLRPEHAEEPPRPKYPEEKAAEEEAAARAVAEANPPPKPTTPAPSIGRIVHYVLAPGEVRPAVVVRVWNGRWDVNLQVAIDGRNDDRYILPSEIGHTHVWRRTVQHDQSGVQLGTWHWPTRSAS